MTPRIRILFSVLIPVALMFGFLDFYTELSRYSFERLHIFLFNLCSGGTILLYYSEGRNITWKTRTFFCVSITYAVLTFYNLYPAAIALTIVLAILVESVRIKEFSLFPLGFFQPGEPVFRKFHQASLLCLSLGLIISSAVILNNEYLHIVNSLPKLQLNTFFLGFSFPVSLITMSLMFRLMQDQSGPAIKWLKETGFWAVNLGVIIFFLFIIFEKLLPQLVVTTILFAAVIMIFFLFFKFGNQQQQKSFLISGMGFLLVTAVTGILYIVIEFIAPTYEVVLAWLLKVHAFASLYGWNLCGIAVICRFDDFPIRLDSKTIIVFHWISVLILAPLGYAFLPVAILALLSFSIILVLILFSRGSRPLFKRPSASGS